MGKYIEQLKNFQTRGDATAKLTEPITSDVSSVLAAGEGLVLNSTASDFDKKSKDMSPTKLPQPFCKVTWWHRLLQCADLSDALQVMKEFRRTKPSDAEVEQVYRVYGVLQILWQNPHLDFLKEEVKRRQDIEVGKAGGLPAAPLTDAGARALCTKYSSKDELWARFWIWVGQQIEAGADESFIAVSEGALAQAILAE